MSKTLPYMLLMGFLAGMAQDARAIAVADLSTSEASPTNSGYTFNWDYVYNYKGASATAVDHYWILTAAHVADDGGSGNLTIAGVVYTQQVVIAHSQASDPDGNATADIALVRFDKQLPGYYLLANSVPVGSEVVVCGYGFSGNVVSTTTLAYFTDNGGSHSTKRWGTNKIDMEKTVGYTGPDPLGTTSNKGFDISISTTKVNAGKTAYEAGCNIYDSGGGMFYNYDGVWKLTGHMTSRYNNGVNFTGNFAVATKYYTNWIKSVIVDYDTDMDGVPDWWEYDQSGSTTGVVASADQDGDGFTGTEEWLADTAPNDSNSFLRISAYTNAMDLVFTSSTNRQYQVQYRADLADTNEMWGTELDWFEGAAPQTVTNLSNASSNRFFRVRAKLP